MAHPKSCISEWLPGFDPDSVEFPDLFSDQASPVIEAAVEPVAASPSSDTCEGSLGEQSVLPLADWRVAKVAANEVKTLWHPLRTENFEGLRSEVAKFNANIDAIKLLRQLEDGNRRVSEDEARILRRFTGWGGLPASFSLDGDNKAWVARAVQLRQLLNDCEYDDALASVNNGHYTEQHVIDAMWTAIRRFGFEGGRILEPSAGVGHFIGAMPRLMAERSTVTAIELDQISGRIIEALYSAADVDVRISSFEDAALSNDWFDLVIGNVPFGNYTVPDSRNRPYCKFSIHNYFFGRALDLARPGGLVCMITSTHTLDAKDEDVCKYIASQASLLGAIRLPKGAFAGLGGTNAQTDIIFLRKHLHPGEAKFNWVGTSRVTSVLRHPDCYAEHMQISCWYNEHPEFCIGKITRESTGYDYAPVAVFDGDIVEALKDRIELLPQGVYVPAPAAKAALRTPPMPVPIGARPGSFIIQSGRLHRVEHGEMVDVHDRLNNTQRARIAGMCAIRDCARNVLDAQLNDADDTKLANLRGMLNNAYDRFIVKHDYLSSRANALAFRRDPDYPLLLSLEHYDEESGSSKKAALFSRRTLARVVEPTSLAEPEEALAASVQWRGRVEPSYMAKLLSSSEELVLHALSSAGKVFLDPADNHWKTADDYLSGNVRDKLKQAVASGSQFEHNVSALEQVQPDDLLPAAIEARLGAVWIPPTDVEGFIREVFELEKCDVAYSALAGTWSVQYAKHIARSNVKVTQAFGTARMNALDLVQCALNVEVPTVRDRDPATDRYFVNRDETLAAREKLGFIKETFAQWAFEDRIRRERLCRVYNDLFNATRPRKFDGSHLKLPGFSNCFTLHPHQKDAIWRVVQTGNTGLFHVVGAGKTAVCVCASMEMRRLGFVNKPVHVVPNHMLEQYTAEFVRLYPNASVLMASKDDLDGDRRRELVSRIATGDWDAVVITHSSFERIRMSPEFASGFIKDNIREIELTIRAEKAGDKSIRIIKQLELMKKRWTAKLDKLLADKKKDDLLTWEQLGVDCIFVDEAHLFKNLFRFTKMTRVAGLPLANSERAFDLFVKTRYTMGLHDGAQRGVVFATATPVANTMAEVHTMMRFLQPNRLVQLGLQQFDAWAATFGECVTALEIAPDGSGYRMNTRFARFINVPELMTIFGEVADIKTAEMLNLPVPKIKGGKPQVIACRASEKLKEFVQTLVERATAIRDGHVHPADDNMLAITTDGRKAALDMRIINPRSGFDKAGKIASCVENVVDIWNRTASFRGTQVVFCDLSSPKGGKGFSVYDDMRVRLVKAGIPDQEIAFIHDADSDAQKAELFRSVREGKVRVLLGSTAKMGIGTNVQTRLYALHHLDAPWRPCDVEQREGRILRQGSMCEEVEIFRYVTEGSFDAYMWQTLETKARFIAQVMKGDMGIRALEDVELATLTYAEVKALASGNPLVIEKAGIDAEVAKLSALFSVWRNQRYANESEICHLPKYIKNLDEIVEMRAQDCERIEAQDAETVVVEVLGRRIAGPADVGETLRDHIIIARGNKPTFGNPVETVIGRFAGFELGIYNSRLEEVPNLYLSGNFKYPVKQYTTGPTLVRAMIDNLESIPKQHAESIGRVEQQRKRLLDLSRELDRPFEHEQKLADLLLRQREMMKLLGLDKDQIDTAGVDSEAEVQAA